MADVILNRSKHTQSLRSERVSIDSALSLTVAGPNISLELSVNEGR